MGSLLTCSHLRWPLPGRLLLMLSTCLQGIRVLDFSHVVAGPLCGMLLGDMGADVVKIESPEGEIGRRIGPPFLNGESVVSLSVNRNKRGLAIDLKTAEGRDAVRTMAAKAHVVIESFRPRVMRKLGLGADSLRASNRDLIYCSISAYGQTGPWHMRPGVDGVIQAVSGLMSTIGEAGSQTPCKMPIPVADMATGYLATIAILGALQQVRTGGGGQDLDISLYNSTLMLQQIGLASYFASGREPSRTGSAAPYAAPNEAFLTSDGWIMVAAYHPERWAALCKVIDFVELANDPLFADNERRVANRAELYALLAPVFRRQPSAVWMQRLTDVDILCAPIATYDEVTRSEQYRHSGIEESLLHPIAGAVRIPAFAIDASRGSAASSSAPPLVGQHSRQVLLDYGIARDDIDAWIKAGVVTAAHCEAGQHRTEVSAA